MPNGASIVDCANLWTCIFKLDHCSKTSCWDGPIRIEHVKKHLNLPTEPQTRPKIAELWSSKFSTSHYTENDNYYLKALSTNNYPRLLLETYKEAKATGEVSFQHWNVTEEFKKYSVYEYSFASDCPGDFYSGSFLRRKFDSLPYEHEEQDIVDYWQKKVERGRQVRVVNFQTGTSLHSLLERLGDIYSSVFIKSNDGFIWVTCLILILKTTNHLCCHHIKFSSQKLVPVCSVKLAQMQVGDF